MTKGSDPEPKHWKPEHRALFLALLGSPKAIEIMAGETSKRRKQL